METAEPVKQFILMVFKKCYAIDDW